jgi:hypothetical protein
VKQLDQENEKLKRDVEDLKSSNDLSRSSLENQKSPMNNGFAKLQTLNSKPETILGQNIPNPFDNSTLIPFRIPKNCHDASIMIVETGTSRVVTVIPITCDETDVQVDAGTLASGTYSYSLYVDGKLIDTKNMELLK